MDAIAVRIRPTSGRAVDRNADRLQINPIGRAGGHGGNQWDTGKVFGDQLFGWPDDLGIEWWRHSERMDWRHHSHLHAGIADRSLESGLGALDRLAWEDAAVDIRRGALRQCVVGVTAFQQGRDASRAQHAVITAILRNDCLGSCVMWILRQRDHRVAQLIRASRTCFGKESTRGG